MASGESAFEAGRVGWVVDYVANKGMWGSCLKDRKYGASREGGGKLIG